MSPNEGYLKDFICPECHIAILQEHPEEKLKILNYHKCNFCGFVKRIDKNPKAITKMVSYGKPKTDNS